MSIAFFAGGFQVFGIGSFGVTYLDLLMLLYYTLYFSKLVIYNQEVRIPKSLITLGIALFFASIFISSLSIFFHFVPEQIVQFFKSFLHFFELILFTIIMQSQEPDMKLADNLFKIWLVVSIILNVFGIYQIFARAYDLPLAWLSYSNVSMTMRGIAPEDASVVQLSLQFGNFFRATSVFSEPTALATFNLYILIAAIIPAVQKHQMFFKSKLLNFIIIFFAVLGLFLSFSLTGTLGLVMILGVIFIVESNRSRINILKYALIAILILIPADVIIEEYTETSVLGLFTQRITGIVNKHDKMYESTAGDSFDSRAQSFKDSKYVWSLSPIIGVGMGLTQFQKNIGITYSDYSIMAALAEMGIIGGLSFTLIFVGLFVVGYKANKMSKTNPNLSETEKRTFGIALYLIIVHFEINFITGNNIGSPNLWFVLVFALIPMYRYMQLANYEFITFRIFNKSIKEKYLLNNYNQATYK